MDKFRVKVEFDLQIDDWEQAGQVALARIRDVAGQSIAEGQGVVSNMGSPEVASYQLSQERRPVVSAVAFEILIRGMQTFPWAELSKPKFSNEPLD